MSEITNTATRIDGYVDADIELSALFSAIEDVIIVVNSAGKYVKIAPSSAPSLYKPPAELIGKTAYDIFPKEVADYFVDCIQKVLVTRKNFKVEYSLPISDREVWFEANLAPLDEDAVVWVARDISSRKLMENQLRQQKESLEQTLQKLRDTQAQMLQSEKMSSLGELVAGIAHEINNPVSFIHTNLYHVEEYSNNLLKLAHYHQSNAEQIDIKELLNEIDLEFIQEDLPKIIKSMKIGTKPIRDIVLSLRNFARMDEAEFKSVDVHSGIDSSIMILHHKLQETTQRPAIEIIKNYGEVPCIQCYPGQLNQVFMNILVNAIYAINQKYINCTFAEIQANPNQIIIQTSVTDSNLLEITIADNGIGMTSEVITKIFNPFFTTKPVGSGTGMGMPISYQIIVEKHQGKLECFSTLNQGTKFVIHIPISQS